MLIEGVKRNCCIIGKMIILLLFVMPFNLSSKDVKITQEYLENSNAEITFVGNSFTIDTGHGGYATGEYRIKNNTLVLILRKNNFYGLDYLINKELHYKVTRNINRIYTDAFVCIDNYREINPIKHFINRASRLPEGSFIKIAADIDVELIKEYEGNMKKKGYVYDFPSPDGNKYLIMEMERNHTPIEYLAAGKSVIVVGRTKKKYKINDKIYHWYLVEMGLNEYDFIELKNKNIKPRTEYQWIFGDCLEKGEYIFRNFHKRDKKNEADYL